MIIKILRHFTETERVQIKRLAWDYLELRQHPNIHLQKLAEQWDRTLHSVKSEYSRIRRNMKEAQHGG